MVRHSEEHDAAGVHVQRKLGITDPTLMGGEIPIMGVAGDQQASTVRAVLF